VIGDAHGGDIAGDPHPFVRLCVFQIGRNVAHKMLKTKFARRLRGLRGFTNGIFPGERQWGISGVV
jgi:hypothetical protein